MFLNSFYLLGIFFFLMENEFEKYLELIFIKKCKNKKNSSSKECLNILFFLKKTQQM